MYLNFSWWERFSSKTIVLNAITGSRTLDLRKLICTVSLHHLSDLHALRTTSMRNVVLSDCVEELLLNV